MKIIRFLIVLFIFIFIIIFYVAATKKTDTQEPGFTIIATGTDMLTMTYEQISQQEAKKIMDTQSNYIIIDARTQEEFDEGHIEGAILIPEYEIHEKAPDLISDKNALILVYCRSGRRSKIASEALAELGYTNVKEFGGIIDWEYEIVK